MASACVQVLLCKRALHVYGSACLCVFSACMLETIAQSQCVTLGLVPQHSPFALASVYLRTKGCCETNDLTPVSQSRRTRDEKKKEVRDGEGGGLMGGSQTKCGGSG